MKVSIQHACASERNKLIFLTSMLSFIKSKTQLIFSFVALELVIQGLNLSAGLFLVRILPKDQYALYTIATSMQASMAVIVDGGIMVGLTAIGGAAFKNRHQFSQIVSSANHIRKRFLIFSFAIVGPLSIMTLMQNNAPLPVVLLITLCVLAGGYFQVSSGVNISVVRLALLPNRIQFVNLMSACLRWGGLLAFFYLLPLTAAIVVLITLTVLAIQTLCLSRVARPYYDPNVMGSADHTGKLMDMCKKVLPGSLYSIFQSQIGVLLISFFGTVESVADLGALGRLAMIFSVISSVMANIVMPRYSQASENVLVLRYLQVLGIFFGLGMMLILSSYFFPEVFLWILGEQYDQLGREVFLMTIASVLASLVGNMWSLNAARGWIMSPLLSISIGVLTQIALTLFFGASTVEAIILISIFSSLVGIGLNTFITMQGFSRLKRQVDK